WAGFLVVVSGGLFCGDTVASEASWSSLRYLLAAPVPRGRLLRQKLLVALGYSLLSLVLVPAVALLVGRLTYGWHPVHTPLGDTYGPGEGLARVALVIGYLAVWMLLVGTLAFWLSTVTDAPLGAVGGAVGLVIVSNILDAITALGSLREVLPTHYQFAWTDALVIPVQYDAMLKGLAGALAYSALFRARAWRPSAPKDTAPRRRPQRPGSVPTGYVPGRCRHAVTRPAANGPVTGTSGIGTAAKADKQGRLLAL